MRRTAIDLRGIGRSRDFEYGRSRLLLVGVAGVLAVGLGVFLVVARTGGGHRSTTAPMSQELSAESSIPAATTGSLLDSAEPEVEGIGVATTRRTAATLDEIRGVVRTPAGESLADAEVSLLSLHGLERKDLLYRHVDFALERTVRERARTTTTEADGSFAFDAPAAGAHLVLARHPEWARGFAEFDYAGAGALDVELIVARGRPASGRVVDTRGEPIAGAEVFSRCDYHGSAAARYETDSRAEIFVRKADIEFGTTDRNGRFAFRSLDDAFEYQIAARGEGFSQEYAWAPRDGAEIVLALHRGAGSVEGTVRGPDGAVVEGAAVFAGVGNGARNDVLVETDERGEFRLEHVAAGTIAISVVAEGFAPWRRRNVWLAPESSYAVDVRLERGAPVRGRAVEEGSGRPVAGLRIRIWIGDEYASPRIRETDEEGRFEFPDASPGPLLLSTIHADTLGYTDLEYARFDGTSPIDLRLQKLGGLEGRVVDRSTREPIRRFEARAVADHAGSTRVSEFRSKSFAEFASEDGGFRFAGLAAGAYRVLVRAEGYAEADAGPFEVPIGANATAAPIEMGPPCSIEGQVTDRDSGVPVAGARVAALQRTRDGIKGVPGRANATTDVSGFYHLNGLPRGNHTVEIESAGHPRNVVDAPRIEAEGDTVRLDVELGGGGRLLVWVRDEEGHPDTCAAVEIFRRQTEEHDRRTSPTDEDGAARFDDLEPALYAVQVWSPAARESVAGRTIEVVEGREAEVTVDRSAGGAIVGRVVRGEQAVSDATLWIADSDPSREAGEPFHDAETYSDEKGRFAFPRLAAGRYRVYCRPDAASAAIVRDVDVPEQGDSEVEFRLGSCVIRGTVVRGVTAEPVPYAGVGIAKAPPDDSENSFEIREPMGAAIVQANAGGEWEIVGVEPGAYGVLAWSDGLTVDEPAVVEVEPSRATIVRLALVEAAGLTVLVEDEGGRPVRNAVVLVYDEDRVRPIQSRETTRQGESVFHHLAPGRYGILAVRPETGSGRIEDVYVGPGRGQRATYRLAAAGAARLRVVRADGTAGSNLPVRLFRGDLEVPRPVFKGPWIVDQVGWATDANGECLLAPLEPGTHRAMVTDAGGDVETSIEVESSETEDATILLPPAGKGSGS